ncbi:MAG: tRNA pseudouridine(38-40) synthase TruA [Saprospiraceae bacterium]|nr:tRNA pseudouridine(38-40) synthase TruA [Saprospiraceae bacterium]
MMRYFAEIQFNGSKYVGWQNQPNGVSVQEIIEEKFSILEKSKIEVVGCGRTDTGVHASQFFLHFDGMEEWTDFPLTKINGLLPKDISLVRIIKVGDEAHARFDATQRSYTYFISKHKNPFNTKFCYQFLQYEKLDLALMQQACEIIKKYDHFASFCKTNSDAKTMKCRIDRLELQESKDGLEVHISADRFLRGMVRLVVGALLNIGMHKVSLDELKSALDHQKRLDQNWSVPAHGLFLSNVRYEYIP